MNKKLTETTYNLPDDVIKHLNHYITVYKGNNDGIKRAQNLLTNKKVNYGELKRILHDLEYSDNPEKFNLYGGEPMKKWGWSILGNERDLILKNKKMSQTSKNITGLGKNPFNKKHTKKQSFFSPPNFFKSNSDVNSVSSILPSTKLFEEIKRIKNLMN